MRVYLDAPPVIYVVENFEPYSELVRLRLQQAETDLIVSDLTRLECRVKPIRDGATNLLRDFDRFFDSTAGEILALSRQVLDEATVIRADYGFRTPDSIHLAAAVTSGCHVFFTNDHRLDRFDRIRVEVVER